MRRFDLTGEWTVRKTGTKKIYKAIVPGCIHSDLLCVGEISDPLLARNVHASEWVAETEWTYENQFMSDDLSAYSRVLLCFDGLEGAATIRLNEVVLGKTEEHQDAAEFNVAGKLNVGKNKLTVAFDARAKKGKEVHAIRSALPTVGIGADVAIQVYNGVRVTDVVIQQDFSDPSVVGLDVTTVTERFDVDRHMELLVRICYKGNTLHEVRDILKSDRQTLHLNLKNAQYWWPAGQGEQPLYEVLVDIFAERSCLEHLARRIGIRQIQVEQAKSPDWRMIVNKHPLFVKGSTWVSPDLYPARLSRVEYARLVKALVVANMNVLCVQEQDAYECNAFYDLCDEYGVLVWHAAIANGFSHRIRRLRHHPCLAVWGNDDAAMGKQLAKEDPGRPVVPKAVAAVPLLPAFQEPRIAATYLAEEERNLSHPMCAFHAMPGSIQTITSHFLEHFLFPTHFDFAVWLSQVQQGLLIKRAWERIRADQPETRRFIYQNLNDFWTQCGPSTVDYDGRWKASHYLLRKAFAPLWTCGAHRAKNGTVDLFAFNDLPKAFTGTLAWRLTRTQGDLLMEGSKKVTVSPASRSPAETVKIAEHLQDFGAADLFLWLTLSDEQGTAVSSNVVLFSEPREWQLPHPRMRAEIRVWDDNSYAVTLTSQQVVMWVWISLEGMDARYDDNFFCLEPGKPTRIRVTPSQRLKQDQFNQRIRIGTLRDTYQEKRMLMQMVAPKPLTPAK